MGWFSGEPQDDGHEGYIVAVVREDGSFRELSYPLDRENRDDIAIVQVGCDCGWRSPRMHAPFGTRFRPYIVMTSPGFEEVCLDLWKAHLDQERQSIHRIVI